MTPRPAYKALEAANILRVSRAWLIQKAASADGRQMGAHRTHGSSGHWRFDPDKFDRYVAELRAGKVICDKKPSRCRRPRSVAMEEWLAGFRKEKAG